MIKTIALAAVFAVTSGTALAADSGAAPVTITLSSYAFTPSAIVLKSGTSYTLHLVNTANKGHNFAAPEFFAASDVAPADASKIKDGAVEVDEGSSVDIALTPKVAGSYPLRCTHFLHTSFGMTGTITVQ